MDTRPRDSTLPHHQVLLEPSDSVMERVAIKTLAEINEELIVAINQQIASRRYMLDELVGTLYPSILQSELEKLEALKAEVVKLGGSV